MGFGKTATVGDSGRSELQGGIGNAGAVFRDGDKVIRPTNPHTSTIHALLEHVRAAGFDGVPHVIGTGSEPIAPENVGSGDPLSSGAPAGHADASAATQSVEWLGFIDGDVPVSPFPTWSQTDAVLASIARIMRRYHDATAGFVPPAGATWSDELADPDPLDTVRYGRADPAHPSPVHTAHAARDADLVICHNDVCPENVVFRNGEAVALLDFDFAAPGRRTYDLACMARMCVPVETDADAARTGRPGLDPFTRLRVVADAYCLGTEQRIELVSILATQFESDGAFVRRRVEAGEQAFIEMWQAMGGQERLDRRRSWFTVERQHFLDALLDTNEH